LAGDSTITSELPPAVAGPSKYSTTAFPRRAAAFFVALPLAARFAEGRLFAPPVVPDVDFTPGARFLVAISMCSVNRLILIAVAALYESRALHEGTEIVESDASVDLHECPFYDVLQLGRV